MQVVGLGESCPRSAPQPEPPRAVPEVLANRSSHDLRGHEESQQHYPSQRPEGDVLSVRPSCMHLDF